MVRTPAVVVVGLLLLMPATILKALQVAVLVAQVLELVGMV